jgi:hypothetical protein
MIFLQPFYDSRMNDLKAATFFSSASAGLFTIMIIILRWCELSPYDMKLFPSRGFVKPVCKLGSAPIIDDNVNVILTSLMYGLVVTSGFLGCLLSRRRRSFLLNRALNRLALDASEKGGPLTYLEIKARNESPSKNLAMAKLSGSDDRGHKDVHKESGVKFIDNEVLWRHVDDYFIFGIGTTFSQEMRAHDVELGARLLLLLAKSLRTRQSATAKLHHRYCRAHVQARAADFDTIALLDAAVCELLHRIPSRYECCSQQRKPDARAHRNSVWPRTSLDGEVAAL